MPSLQMNYVDFQLAVSEYLGWGVDPTLWQPEQVDKLLRTITTGYFRFLSPELQPEVGRVNWSFMKPIGQITTLAPVNGTATSGTTTTLTDSGAAFASLTGTDIQVTTGEGVYTRHVSSNTSTAITWPSTGVGGGAVAGIDAGDLYTISQIDYPLPADFSGMVGKMFYSPDSTTWLPLPIISEQQILEMRSVQRMTSGVPMYAAVASSPSTSVAPQTMQVKLWPYPGAAYGLRFRYKAVPVPLSASYPYPLGGAFHSDTIRASCLAVAELENFDTEDVQRKNYERRLQASVIVDAEQNSTQTMGEVKDGFDPRYLGSSARYPFHYYGQMSINGVPNV